MNYHRTRNAEEYGDATMQRPTDAHADSRWVWGASESNIGISHRLTQTIANTGAKLTGSDGFPLIVLITNTSLCEEGGGSAIPSLSRDISPSPETEILRQAQDDTGRDGDGGRGSGCNS